MTYRYVDGQWQKQFKFYDYLGSLRFTMKADGTLLNFKQYAAFGETTLDTLGVTRQGYIGKKKDVENNLGDHGVRKYDYETGRFNSIDPLWEKYYGWTPYQYCMNNPIWAKDYDGKAAMAAPLAVKGAAIGAAGGGFAIGKLLVFVGSAVGSAVLVAEGEKIIDEATKLEATLSSTKLHPATLNPNAQDATATNVNMMDAQQKLEKQMAKQDRKSPESQGKKPDGGNKEIYEALKRSLAGSYGARKTAEILQDKNIKDLLHEFQKQYKGVQNVAKERIPEVVKEFRDLIGK